MKNNYLIGLIAVVSMPMMAHGMPTISNVTARQIDPWQIVEIKYEVGGTLDDAYDYSTVVDVIDKNTSVTNRLTKLLRHDAVSVGINTIVWSAQDESFSIDSDNVMFVVTCTVQPNLYCVIDLSDGPNATSYPISYLPDIPTGGWTDEYKTTKIVLRRIEPGSFQTSSGANVTLTKPYYMCVFEVTQKQYELVTGLNPNSPLYGFGDTHPVQYVSYDMIRGKTDGAMWPSSPQTDANSFLGRMRALTVCDEFDLPTEAQWEYACRAGSTTAYYWGDTMDGDYAWYSDNSGSCAHSCGTKLPNAWGLYDMKGNAEEWCLDWWSNGMETSVDPKGNDSGYLRVLRGGRWSNNAIDMKSSYRAGYYPSYESVDHRLDEPFGFRFARTVPTHEQMGVVSEAMSDSCAINTSAVQFSIPNKSVISGGEKMVLSFPSDESAIIYYTTDGSIPTNSSEVFTRPFRVSPYVKIQARAFSETFGMSKVSVCELGAGILESPVIIPSDRSVIESGAKVVITSPIEGATIFYTTDGSDPTTDSTVFTKPFRAYGRMTVKAMSWIDNWIPAPISVSTFSFGNLEVVINAPATFGRAYAMVAIESEAGATIHYTLDGSEPTMESPIYSGPFKVSETTTVKAFAVKDDYLDSDVAAFTVTKVWTMGDSLNAPNIGFASASAQPWTVVTDETKDGVEALKSGNPGNDGESVVSAVVTGGGTVAFWWKSSCEDDEDPDAADWDHLEFRVDGAVRAFLDGETDWTLVTIDVTGDGEHTLEWAYKKDDSWSDGQDCGWLDLVAWSPADGSGATQTTEAQVPYSWLDEKGFGELVGVDYEVAAKSATGKRDGAGRALTVMDDFVAGTDPTDETDVFKASITFVDGNPVINWTPELPEAEAAKRKYTIFGKSKLSDTDWSEVAEGEEGNYNFFKVTVEMP